MAPDLTHISEGNSKTGCFSFDLPAIVTCPGRTKECERDCYAANLMRIYPSVAAKYSRNHDVVFHPGFVSYMVETIPADCQFRIHVSGDFFHADYVRQWIDIATQRPDVTFYAYTRSWRDHEILGAIIALNFLDNVNVNLSVDDETGRPKFLGAYMFRWCYLTKTDTVPPWMRRDDIVFRSNHNGHKRRRNNAEKKGENPNIIAPLLHVIGQATVCPKERGKDIPLSCAKCRLCVDKPKVLAHV